VLEADRVVDEPDDEGEEERDRHAGGGRELEDGDHARQVAQVDEDEQGEEERRPAEPVAPDRLHHDLVLDEVDARLGEVAHARRRHHRVPPGGDDVDRAPDQDGETRDDRHLVERAEEVLPADDLVDRGKFQGEH
jgi:hypothetical protein